MDIILYISILYMYCMVVLVLYTNMHVVIIIIVYTYQHTNISCMYKFPILCVVSVSKCP